MVLGYCSNFTLFWPDSLAAGAASKLGRRSVQHPVHIALNLAEEMRQEALGLSIFGGGAHPSNVGVNKKSPGWQCAGPGIFRSTLCLVASSDDPR